MKLLRILVGITIVILFLGGVLFIMVPKPTARVTFSCTTVSANSNTNLISIVISNQSNSKIVYYVGTPVVKSNETWERFYYPSGTRLTSLGPDQSATIEISAPVGGGEAKIPVLWGFNYSARAPRWREFYEDIVARMRMHDSRGRGALYTNYIEGIHL